MLRGSADKEIHVTTRDAESCAASMSILSGGTPGTTAGAVSEGELGPRAASSQAACDGSVMNGQ